ncbi:MAG: flagellar hook-associated protein FlgL [Phycisphaerae bacterium]|nr:flagellar hook-associated protein FlgL [Phycisphaerae bacterium]
MGSWGAIYNNAMYGIRTHVNRMTMLQEQISTGSRVIRASDSPADAYQILSLRGTISDYENYFDNIGEVELSLQEGANAMDTLSDIANRVNVLLNQSASGTYAADNRASIAEEVNELLEQATSMANHKVLGRYIFAGANSTSPAYNIQWENNRIVSVDYQGSYEERPIPVGPGVNYSGQLVGDRIFRNNVREAPAFYGDTGAAVGSGTASARGDLWMTVNRTGTTYPPASNVAAGTDADQDTILGNYALTIAGGNTIQLGSGPVETFNGTETNLVLTSEDGTVVHVDTTGGLVNGVYVMTGEGEISIDGHTATTLDAAAYADGNLIVNTSDGGILYVDAQNIRHEGLEAVRIPGTYDLFNTLIYVRDLMLNTNNLDDAAQSEAMTRSLDSLDAIRTGFVQRSTIIGGRLGGLDSLRSTLDNLKYHAGAKADAIEQADIVDVATDLARTETLYNMSLLATSKVISMTLLDYMR